MGFDFNNLKSLYFNLLFIRKTSRKKESTREDAVKKLKCMLKFKDTDQYLINDLGDFSYWKVNTFQSK